MMDKLIEKYRKHISSLFDVDCSLLNVQLKTFGESNIFCKNCTVGCDFVNTHLYGCYESARWDNKYIYYCPSGYIFIAVPILEEADVINEAIITGPLLMGDIEELEDTCGLVHFETTEVNDIAEILSAVFAPRIKSVSQAEFSSDLLNDIYAQLEVIHNKENYPINLEYDLKTSIVEGDSAKAKELINKILGQIFFHSCGDCKTIKTRILELVVLLSRSAIDGGANVEEIFMLNNNYIQEVEKCTSLDKLSFWLNSIINRFVSYVFEFNDAKHTDIIFKTTAYIKNNYMKKISLDDIADHVYLSKSYLSKVFKEEMNITLSSYINKIRIEKSKVLLHDSSLALADVANLVGFVDQSYFNKVFRNVTGISPGKYRIKHGVNINEREI